MSCRPLAETDGAAAGSKRTAEESEEVPAAKRVCVGAKRAAPEDYDVIDVETLSLSSAEEGVIRGQSDFGLGETEENDEEEEAANSSDEVISVGGGDCGQTGGAPPPHPGSTAGSPEDTEIDVIGGSSPCPAPVMLTWTEPSEEDEEEEEVDIEEEKTEYSSSAVIHILC